MEELDYWLAAEPFPKAIMGDERSHLGGASQHAIGNVIAAPTCCPTAESFAIALLLGFASGRPLLIRNQRVRDKDVQCSACGSREVRQALAIFGGSGVRATSSLSGVRCVRRAW